MAEERPFGARRLPSEGSAGRDGSTHSFSSGTSAGVLSEVEKENLKLERFGCSRASSGVLSEVENDNLRLERFGCVGASVFGGVTQPGLLDSERVSASAFLKPKSKAASGDEEDVGTSSVIDR